jgi:hypothetical protein
MSDPVRNSTRAKKIPRYLQMDVGHLLLRKTNMAFIAEVETWTQRYAFPLCSKVKLTLKN